MSALRIVALFALTVSACSGSSAEDLGPTDTGARDQGSVDVADLGPDASTMDTGSDAGADAGVADAGDAGISALWALVDSQAQAHEIPSLALIVGDADGVLFSTTKGAGTLDTRVAIASATKWYSAAVFARLIDSGVLSLDANPQDYLAYWTFDANDPRSRVTLEQLLSFTSGFSGRPGDILCTRRPQGILQDCAQEIYNDDFVYEPGSTFFYGPGHMHIAAAMAEVATGKTWVTLVAEELNAPLGMSADTSFTQQAITNPLISGGMRSTARDYGKFLQGFFGGSYLPNWTSPLSADRTATASIAYSPVDETLPGTAWHYALGHWLECETPPFSPGCDDRQLYSSPGAFGFYPWIDRQAGYWAVLAVVLGVNDPAGTPTERAYDLVDSIRPQIDSAVANP